MIWELGTANSLHASACNERFGFWYVYTDTKLPVRMPMIVKLNRF